MNRSGDFSVCHWCREPIGFVSSATGGIWVNPTASTYYMTCALNPDRDHMLQSKRNRAGHKPWLPDLGSPASVERWLAAP